MSFLMLLWSCIRDDGNNRVSSDRMLVTVHSVIPAGDGAFQMHM